MFPEDPNEASSRNDSDSDATTAALRMQIQSVTTPVAVQHALAAGSAAEQIAVKRSRANVRLCELLSKKGAHSFLTITASYIWMYKFCHISFECSCCALACRHEPVASIRFASRVDEHAEVIERVARRCQKEIQLATFRSSCEGLVKLTGFVNCAT